MALQLQARDHSIIRFVADYGVVTRRQICNELGEPDRSMRRRLGILAKEDYLKRHDAPVCDGMNSIPVYASSRKGLQAISQMWSDDSYLHFPVGFPQQQNLVHSVEVAHTHTLFTHAIEKQDDPKQVELGCWFHEGQKIVPFAEPSKTTVINGASKSALCRPDAVFSLRMKRNAFEGLFFLEEDRDTSWVQKVFKKKLPGFELAFKAQKYREHFGTAIPNLSPVLRVLFFCPTENRRDALKREAERQLAGKDPGFVDLFRFIAKYGPEKPLTTDDLLFEPIAYRCGEDSPLSLVRLQASEPTENDLTAVVTSPLGQGGHADGHLSTVGK